VHVKPHPLVCCPLPVLPCQAASAPHGQRAPLATHAQDAAPCRRRRIKSPVGGSKAPTIDFGSTRQHFFTRGSSPGARRHDPWQIGLTSPQLPPTGWRLHVTFDSPPRLLVVDLNHAAKTCPQPATARGARTWLTRAAKPRATMTLMIDKPRDQLLSPCIQANGPAPSNRAHNCGPLRS